MFEIMLLEMECQRLRRQIRRNLRRLNLLGVTNRLLTEMERLKAKVLNLAIAVAEEAAKEN